MKLAVKRLELIRVGVAAVVAAVLLSSGALRLPDTQPEPFRHPPVFVYAEPMLPPLVVRARKTLLPSLPHIPRLQYLRSALARAEAGVSVPVSLTQYCLQGTTRRDHWVKPGIVAADPHIFPLARYVEVFLGKHYLGRFLVDDTGGNVKGATLDIWTPSCSDARRFGRQHGTATLVMKPER